MCEKIRYFLRKFPFVFLLFFTNTQAIRTRTFICENFCCVNECRLLYDLFALFFLSVNLSLCLSLSLPISLQTIFLMSQKSTQLFLDFTWPLDGSFLWKKMVLVNALPWNDDNIFSSTSFRLHATVPQKLETIADSCLLFSLILCITFCAHRRHVIIKGNVLPVWHSHTTTSNINKLLFFQLAEQ